MHYLFLCRHLACSLPPLPAPVGRTLECWRPGWTRLLPAGFPAYPFLLWGLFHVLRVFRSRDYAILILRAGGQVVHRTCLVPAHFRFPFMRPGDVQAAGIWTHPDHRGLGLGQFVLHEATRRLRRPGHRLWYLVREDNPASVRLAEKAGFDYRGRGARQGLGGWAFRITGGRRDRDARWTGGKLRASAGQPE